MKRYHRTIKEAAIQLPMPLKATHRNPISIESAPEHCEDLVKPITMKAILAFAFCCATQLCAAPSGPVSIVESRLKHLTPAPQVTYETNGSMLFCTAHCRNFDERKTVDGILHDIPGGVMVGTDNPPTVCLILPLNKAFVFETESTPSLSSGLGKRQDYFKKLYGEPKSKKRLTQHVFTWPDGPQSVRLDDSYIEHTYQHDKLQVTVLFAESTEQAIWVHFTLSHSWTKEQINAALASYGSKWKVVKQDLAVKLLFPDMARTTYRSSEGCIAYKDFQNKLILYAPQLAEVLKKQVQTQNQEKERQRKAVPQF